MSSLRQLSRRRTTTARKAAYDALRGAIVAGELTPGTRLSENELAELLGVSRTPVREALLRLREDQLVDVVPQSGTFVTPISTSAVRDAQFLREAVECAAVRLATERATPPDVAALRDLLARQEVARDTDDLDAFFVLDGDFHHALCDLSGRPIAWAIGRRANGHLDRVRRLSLPVPSYIAEMVEEHRRVVDAVELGDPDLAEASLRHHLRMVLSGLPRIRAERPELFDDDDEEELA
ncbi:MAG: GntR family transcriptional regulator [Solirubrobacterales bacterium]|nr:GntR family transcriptional regulator [Solirubrobacterales bacterium]